jgi:hypothetical protein
MNSRVALRWCSSDLGLLAYRVRAFSATSLGSCTPSAKLVRSATPTRLLTAAGAGFRRRSVQRCKRTILGGAQQALRHTTKHIFSNLDHRRTRLPLEPRPAAFLRSCSSCAASIATPPSRSRSTSAIQQPLSEAGFSECGQATGSREAREPSSAKHYRGMYSSSRGNAWEANGSRRCSAPSGVSPGNMSAMMRTSAPSLRFMPIASFTR